jgi:hypothetical protein
MKGMEIRKERETERVKGRIRKHCDRVLRHHPIHRNASDGENGGAIGVKRRVPSQ